MDESTELSLKLWVPGRPAPEGSLVAFGRSRRGRPLLHHSNRASLAPWRAVLQLACAAAWRPRPCLHGPVQVIATFYTRAPEKPRHPGAPITRSSGDLDKLCRALLDALTGVVLADDSIVVQLFASKEHAHVLRGPGVQLAVLALDPAYEAQQRARRAG